MPRRIAHYLLVTAAFAALVLLLLRFQGILGRHEPELDEVPPPPLVSPAATVAPARLELVPDLLALTGRVEAVDVARIGARVTGDIEEVTVREDDEVAEGALLVRLDDRDARARRSQAAAALESAQVEAARAATALARATGLFESGSLPAQAYESATAARDTADAGVRSAEESVLEAASALDYYALKAPFAGRVLERLVDPGDLAAPGQPLLTLFRPARLRLAVPVPAAHAAGLQPGDRLDVELAEGEPRALAVTRVLPSADPRTGTVTVQLTLPADSGARPGQLARAWLEIGRRERLVVPAAAVERIGQVERVRRVHEGRAVPTIVRTGQRLGDRIEILSGLTAGEEVVLP